MDTEFNYAEQTIMRGWKEVCVLVTVVKERQHPARQITLHIINRKERNGKTFSKKVGKR